MLPVLLLALAPAAVPSPPLSSGNPGDELERDLARFWAAPTVAERRAVAAEIVAAGPPFERVLAGLERGRTYSADVPRGRLLRERTGVDGLRHPYMILVPEDYTPERSWPVRFDLHGGMGVDAWPANDGAWAPGWGAVRDAFVVAPAGWWDSMWWEWSQVESFEAILRELRATWNVDTNRVVLYGGSDGGAGLFFQAMRQPDRWSGYGGVVAPPDRLVRADFRPDGQLHVSNLAGQRFQLCYGEKDRKVPLEHVTRYMELFERAGAVLDWYVVEGRGHQFQLPKERDEELAHFLGSTVRDPLPDRVSWATERTDRYNRRSWIVIDELEAPGPDHAVDETNLLPRWGTAIQLRGPTVPRVPWGRVDARREGNLVRVTTRRVARFTILVAPSELDLSQPVVVEVDGRRAFDARVEPSVATLLERAAVDDDPRLLFAAELTFEP